MRVFEKDRYVVLWNPHKQPHTQWLNIALRRFGPHRRQSELKDRLRSPPDGSVSLFHVINLDAISTADRGMDQGLAPHRRCPVTLIARHVIQAL